MARFEGSKQIGMISPGSTDADLSYCARICASFSVLCKRIRHRGCLLLRLPAAMLLFVQFDHEHTALLVEEAPNPEGNARVETGAVYSRS